MDALILTQDDGNGIVRVLLNRPDRRNALSIDLLEELCGQIRRLEADENQRVVILTGAGPVFSAGLDLKEACDDSLVERSAACVHDALQLMRQTSLIVIAAVNGGAIAGGAGLMAACDLVIAADNARIGFPEARRGLLPALISDVLRTRVREGDLRDLFLTGEAVDAHRACEMGLVQRVAPADQLLAVATSAAESIIAGGPETVRRTKQLLNDLFDGHEIETGSDMQGVHLEARRSQEAREGLAAFLEKRQPFWVK